MASARRFCFFVAAILSIHSAGFAQEAADSDDVASEFKGVKLIMLRQHGDSYTCNLYTDAEHKQLRQRHEEHKRKGSLGNDPLSGKYLILEVKRDRLVLAPEVWADYRKIRVIPLRYISEIYRTDAYEEGK